MADITLKIRSAECWGAAWRVVGSAWLAYLIGIIKPREATLIIQQLEQYRQALMLCVNAALKQAGWQQGLLLLTKAVSLAA
ncbi:MAG: hypothetical protein B7Z75_02305 [Acidocella sp. 20-57-95]|nr:MAG: hypothetical protein B7Z75_02305 [Acidocella sp. 20-57-95]OYV59072.1 MAG: hypothetical protein B7Z71_08830 [Acidocella sp. 21-58-7]HQT63836.1 hypothetical protein [Acidocella sp.]HQU04693.1 hypothetical protein [Acidocella sp.]